MERDGDEEPLSVHGMATSHEEHPPTEEETDTLSIILTQAREALENAREKGAGLLLLTGAGMSVSSGVPVFRNANNGTMSIEFMNFLQDYNISREDHGLKPADDWFDFSRPEMFDLPTERQAWQYWRWRILRAKVTRVAQDYQDLNQLIHSFGGTDHAFCVTSNCDGLHEMAGLPKERIYEVHGSLSRLQCSGPCENTLYPVDYDFVEELRQDNTWKVPRCSNCSRCLRPNVMIFGDNALVNDVLEDQSVRRRNFLLERDDNFIVLEIGAGLVVPSIRNMAEKYGSMSRYGLIRINPSENCLVGADLDDHKYFPIQMTSTEALHELLPSRTQS
jgi:NAD-dependent SIR2 family protein deacetylase